MAKQTINIGASPNDGTGTPLRTAFDYTNQNFTELYTATGPSGNNIVVPGNATITGDLTVDTNVLKVDTTNNRVGIGTASPIAGIKLDIVSTTSDNFVRFSDSVNATGYLGVRAANGAVYLHGNNNIVSLSCSTSNTTATEQLRITNPGVFEFLDGLGGTRMTLNSTGLGVGGAPISGFRLNVNNGDFRVSDAQNEDGVEIGWSPSAGGLGFVQAYNRTTSAFKDLVLNAAVTINTAGNVGIGVTPSYKLDVSTGGALNTTARLVGNDQTNVRLRFENTGAGGRIWELVGGFAGSNNRWFSLRDVTGSTTPWGVDDSMNVISNVTGTAPTLATNSQMVFNLTSNTNLRISVRGTDGTTRTANITLA